ncbi:MAG TPA: acyl-ACP--UDP-N-acetylglucosamine O-acyltransferase [Candidatus Dormibacteraeota bacterium]|nr:acyl-ACP--UDP-N-acetylglucosamine O-acyltransferase [Candidatus Dormibacteraeota bacterium]
MSEIDPRAIVSPSARLGKCVKVAACAVVGDDVELGDGCVLEPHAVVKGPSKFGRDNHFHSFSIVGGDPQDYTFTGQPVRLEVGDANEFREFCTVHRGTLKGDGTTRMGSRGLIMAYAHIGHDCTIGDNVTLINGAQLAGHSRVEDYATLSSFVLVHQFTRIGCYSYIGAGTIITQDVPPFSLIVSSRDTHCYGINRVGLERRGFSPKRIQVIEKAFRYLLRSKLNTSQALEKMRGTLADSDDVSTLIRFIESTTERGLTK